MKRHPSVTLERIMDGARESMFGMENPGICIACGADADGCEPDAELSECEVCGENQVFGCEQLLLLTVP